MDVDAAAPQTGSVRRRADSDSGSDDGDVEMINVDFDFFDPQPEDKPSLRHLFSQLLAHDSNLLDLDLLADVVVEQNVIGSTVKTVGEDGDPYAILSVINLNTHKSKPGIQALCDYLLERIKGDDAMHSKLAALLSRDTSAEPSSKDTPRDVGLVLSERLVNMPPKVTPPMYRMMNDELDWARQEGSAFHFSHLLFLSRVFVSSADALENDPNASLNEIAERTRQASGQKGSKKSKKGKKGDDKLGAKEEDLVWSYHPEDDFIAKFAEHTQVYPFKEKPAEQSGEDSFGVPKRGQLMLVPYAKWPEIVGGMEKFVDDAIEA